MLQSGYLTKATNYSYTIPNREVREYFYEKLLPIWINREFGNNVDIRGLLNELVQNIENKIIYAEVIQTKLLDRLLPGEKTESDFQALLGGIANFASITEQNVNHTYHSELYTDNGKIIDGFFSPINGKSDTVIICEYKKKDNSNKIDYLIEDALWQIYVNQYINKAILLKKNHNNNWKNIIVRVILFFKSEISGKWTLQITELNHTFNQAKEVNELFSQEGGEILDNQKELLGKVTADSTNSARETFLKERNANTIYDLLNKYTNKSSQ